MKPKGAPARARARARARAPAAAAAGRPSIAARLLRSALALLLLALPAGAAVAADRALTRYALLVTPWKRDPGPVFVDVPAGSGAAAAVRALVGAGVLRDAEGALLLLGRAGKSRALRAGEYRFDRPLSPVEVLRRLLRGEVFLRRLTIPEGLTRWDVAARFAASGLGPAEELLAATGGDGVAAIADLDAAATDLEGYLFPETYHLGRRDGAAALVAQMVARFRAMVGADPGARAAALGLSLRQVVTLASLVEKETARAEERPLVAGVYLGRLRRGMLLQADPTVIYGLLRAGRWTGNLRRADLREPGPYNTYLQPGLPPGPIASPGRAALEAAFAPAATELVYFVSRNDGSHVFSRTLAEHNQRVQAFQRNYWREQRQRRPAGSP